MDTATSIAFQHAGNFYNVCSSPEAPTEMTFMVEEVVDIVESC